MKHAKWLSKIGSVAYNLLLRINVIINLRFYNLKILKKNIQDEKNNVTRFLLMGKEIYQPELKNKNYITSFLFKLKSKPAALYSALSGFAINGVNMTKLQSFHCSSVRPTHVASQIVLPSLLPSLLPACALIRFHSWRGTCKG